MSGPTEFNQFAAECRDLAQQADSDRRAWLIKMAQAWERLAAEAERFEKLLRDVDQAFDAPSRQQVTRRSH